MPDYTVSADVDSMLRSANDAAIRSAIGVGTTDAPTFLAQTLTGQSLTGTQDTSLVDLDATWNTSGTPTAIKLNVVETGINSNAASKLLDLQVGGVSKFSARKDGIVTSALRFSIGAAGMWETGMSIGSGLSFSWSSTGTYTSPADLILARDAAGILAQRNVDNAQTFRVYNGCTLNTPAANHDRAMFGFTSNVLRIGTENAGIYTLARPIDFVTGGVVRMSIAAAGNVSIAGTFNFGSSNGALPGGTNYGGNLGTSQDFAIRGTSTTATNIYIQNGSSGNKQGWVRVLGSGSVDHGALEVGAIGSSPVIFTTALTERMRLSAAGNLGIGTTSPTSKLQVSDGDIEVDTIAKGVILKSPDGTRYRVTVPNGGAVLTITAV